MSRLVVICFILWLTLPVFGQELSLIFKAEGAASSIDRVEVANLDAGITLTISGLDILQLLMLSDNFDVKAESDKEVTLRPEMRKGNCTVDLYMRQNGAVKFELLNATGNVLVLNHFHLSAGDHQFKITGMETGAHRLIVTTPAKEYSHWLMSGNTRRNIEAKIEYKEGPGATRLENYVMPDGKSITMPYRRGERLLFKATAGNLQAIAVRVPKFDEMIRFHFAPCIDADGNKYSTVNIGSQLWMAENLKSTRFNDGRTIELITKTSDWRETEKPAYCWYENSEQLRDWYGALYNWHVINEGNICPRGWRVPTDADWYDFEVYIDSTIQINTALGWRGSHGGASLKASSGWADRQNGFNVFGFTALPAGRRGSNGHFNSAEQYTYWWTASASKEDQEAWSRYILPDYEFFYRGSFMLNYGFSIRCIKE